jgi:hypothetical protein
MSFSQSNLMVVLVFVTLSTVGPPVRARSAEPPRITQTEVVGDRIRLNWDGEAPAYDILTTSDLAAPQWNLLFHTVRTNLLLPAGGMGAFFRVACADSIRRSLRLVMTNLASGDVIEVNRRVQTDRDLVFSNLANTNASIPVEIRVEGQEREKMDIRFDPAGGFRILTAGGRAGGAGGVMDRTLGPGLHDTTYTGYLTNEMNVVLFSAVAGPRTSGAVRPLDAGAGDTGDAGDVAGAAFSAVWCASTWALQNHGCQAEAASRGPGCVGFFPPKPSTGYGYIASRTAITITPSGLVGNCESKCITCCRDLFTGALSECTE